MTELEQQKLKKTFLYKHGITLLALSTAIPIGGSAFINILPKPLHNKYYTALYGTDYAKISANSLKNMPKWLIMMHTSAGVAALVFYTAQFSSSLRKKYFKIHKQIGYVGMASAFTVGVSGLIWSYKYASYGVTQTLPTFVSSVGICFSVLKSLQAKRINNDIKSHIKWNIRTFEFFGFSISVRLLWMPLVHILGMNAHDLMQTTFWGGLLANVMIGEYVNQAYIDQLF